MTAKEKNAFYVKLNLKYQNNKSNSTDNLTFLRNDNQYQKDISIKTKTVSIPPGIYKLLSDNADLGEIELLTPGTNLNISIDYTTKTITIETTNPKTKIKIVFLLFLFFTTKQLWFINYPFILIYFFKLNEANNILISKTKHLLSLYILFNLHFSTSK